MSDTMLYEKGSAEDLIIRGASVPVIRKHFPERKELTKACADEWLAEQNIDLPAYMSKWVAEYIGREKAEAILSRHASDVDFGRREVLDCVGVLRRKLPRFAEGCCPMAEMFRDVGLYDAAKDATRRHSVLVRDKATATIYERYGSEGLRHKDIREKSKNTCLARYGTENPAQNEGVKQKMYDTMINRYGVKVYTQSPEMRAVAELTNIKRYGVSCALHSDSVKAKAKAAVCSQSAREKMKRTNFERYGSETALLNEDVIEKAKATLRRVYGVDFPTQSFEIRDRVKRTVQERYGVDNVSQCPEIIERIRQTKLEHSTYNTSQDEERMYFLLIDRYGEGDVVRQYKSEAYPFSCDFYITSRDLYIELNLSWTHGGHCYGDGFDADGATVELCRAKGSDFYDSMLYVWTESDVKKRRCAADNMLKYVVLWSSDDVGLWAGMGFPDGYDWKGMYTWLPDRELDCHFAHPAVMVDQKQIPKAVVAVQYSEFYKPELDAWTDNRYIMKGTFQSRLYAHMYKVCGKLPDELTDKEILKGLSLSGLVKGNRMFCTAGQEELMHKYKTDGMYDPYMGFGERMLCAYIMDSRYYGSESHGGNVTKNNHTLYQWYAHRCYDDSGNEVDIHDVLKTPVSYDTVFTRPPYDDYIIYDGTDRVYVGEDGFLKWWIKSLRRCVNADVKVVAYQTDKAHKEILYDSTIKALDKCPGTWRYAEEIPVPDVREFVYVFIKCGV